MSFSLGEARAEECGDELLGERRAHDARAEAENVHRIVLDALVGGERVVAERGTNAVELVRRHRGADAAPADQHRALRPVLANRHRHSLGVVGIVVAGDQLLRAAVELAKDWRSDRVLRRLEALLAVTDAESGFIISGTGDIIEPDDGILAIGSGGTYALAAARALLTNTDLSPREIVQRGLGIAAEICVYTNSNITVLEPTA